ncbi:unnamed protein product [Orchesella dallaii]|uniref:GT23 domain-containing protein n=1 Tax=Orchesella dallaii TaxID=48710 RepID=A0ABP1R591_9HEXA
MILIPRAVPSEILSRLDIVSSNPVMWWVGQFATYVLRPTPETERIERKAKANRRPRDFQKNITTIGIHVRGTDKLDSEAKSYPLEEYFKQVEIHLAIKERIEGFPITAHIFLATDEPKVIQEAGKLEQKYNGTWIIWANESAAKEASTSFSRFESGIMGILIDVLVLADCEFVVCTFSSNICRLVAELKEVEVDKQGEVVSLDSSYHFIPFAYVPS